YFRNIPPPESQRAVNLVLNAGPVPNINTWHEQVVTLAYRTVQPGQVPAGERRKAKPQKIPGGVYRRLHPHVCFPVSQKAVRGYPHDLTFGNLKGQACTLIENRRVPNAAQATDTGAAPHIYSPGNICCRCVQDGILKRTACYEAAQLHVPVMEVSSLISLGLMPFEGGIRTLHAALAYIPHRR